MIYNLIWSRIGSTWNLVGICLEFGRNDSESRSNLGGFSLTFHSYQIPTIPTIPPGFLPFQSDSTWNLLGSTWIPSTLPGSGWNVRGRVKYCSQSSGRLTPGCGQAGQKTDSSPGETLSAVLWSFPYPAHFSLFIHRHIRVNLLNSLYRSATLDGSRGFVNRCSK